MKEPAYLKTLPILLMVYSLFLIPLSGTAIMRLNELPVSRMQYAAFWYLAGVLAGALISSPMLREMVKAGGPADSGQSDLSQFRLILCLVGIGLTFTLAVVFSEDLLALDLAGKPLFTTMINGAMLSLGLQLFFGRLELKRQGRYLGSGLINCKI